VHGNRTSIENAGDGEISNQGGAESGALGADSPLIDSDLQVIVTAWPALPEAVRAGILAMIGAVT
jgi:hypothetical protein